MPETDTRLRPMERRMIKARDTGIGLDEIARRFGKSPRQVRRILTWVEIPRPPRRSKGGPSAIATRVVAMRDSGLDHREIAMRFRRSTRSIQQIEGLARVRFGRDEKVFALGMGLLRAAGREARAEEAQRSTHQRT